MRPDVDEVPTVVIEQHLGLRDGVEDLPVLAQFLQFRSHAIDNLSQYKIITAPECRGSIDVVNGITPAPEHLAVAGVLHVSGWLADSISRGTLPESTFIVLKNGKGAPTFIQTERISRPDVGEYFKRSRLSEAGCTGLLDLSAMQGQYTLGLAKAGNGTIEMCDSLKIDITVQR